MRQYLELLKKVLVEGQRQSNRTGIDTLTIPGEMLKFDLREGFPAVTTKKLMWDGVKGELIAFLEGTTSLARFKELGCNVWDENVLAPKWQNSEACSGPDDMGYIYGYQWRNWMGCWDQIGYALDQVRNNPESRRIIVNAWNPMEIDMAALPPCHTGFQLLPRSDGTLHMTMSMRSVDMFLGCPFNIASYALLLELFAWWTGRTAATLTMFLSDVHIYVNHIDQVNEQLSREPLSLSRLWIESMAGPDIIQKNPIEVLIASLDPKKLHLMEYQHHAAIKAKMAV